MNDDFPITDGHFPISWENVPRNYLKIRVQIRQRIIQHGIQLHHYKLTITDCDGYESSRCDEDRMYGDINELLLLLTDDCPLDNARWRELVSDVISDFPDLQVLHESNLRVLYLYQRCELKKS